MFELPEKITPEFLDDLEWKPGPLPTYEITELGLVRRPQDVDIRGVFPGFLYSPNLAIRRGPHYRLNPGGDKASVYLSPSVVMNNVFGKFRNKLLLRNDYAHQMKTLIIEYNQLHFREKRRLPYEQAEENGMIKMRRCCDCGAKTRNYRCDACWVVIRARATSCDEPSAEYKILGGR